MKRCGLKIMFLGGGVGSYKQGGPILTCYTTHYYKAGESMTDIENKAAEASVLL